MERSYGSVTGNAPTQVAKPQGEISQQLDELNATLNALEGAWGDFVAHLKPVLHDPAPPQEPNLKEVGAARTSVGSQIESARRRIVELERSVRFAIDILAL